MASALDLLALGNSGRAGTEFELLAQSKLNGDYIGLYQDPNFGEIVIHTTHAVKVEQ